MRSLISVLFWLIFSNLHCYKQAQARAVKKVCRCEGNGPCDLEPRLSKTKLKGLAAVQVSKTSERAYSLVEKTRLVKEGVELAYTQGGCDHSFRRVTFVANVGQPVSDFLFHLSKVAVVLDAIEETDMSQAAKLISAALKAEKPRDAGQTNNCRKTTNEKSSCFARVVQDFSWVEIVFEKSGKLTAYEITFTEAH
jgi:hypothetical protein